MPSADFNTPPSLPPSAIALHRRQFGLLLGALTAFAYTLVMQTVNPLAMPGVPFYQPPFGPLGNILLGVVVGGLVGYITAWAETGARGVLLGAIAGALVLSAASLVSGRGDPALLGDRVIALLIIFAPTTALIALALILFRWLVNREEEAHRESFSYLPPARLPRVALPALLVVFAAAAGLTNLYNDLARAVIPRMADLVEEASRAPAAEALPEPLRAAEVPDFYAHARQPYTIQWDKDDANRFAIPRPNTSPFDQSTVIARFADGYLLACMYPDPSYAPRCKGFPAQ